MKPIYFPFTFISKPIVNALGACFRQIVVYRPSCRSVPENMQKLQESDLIKIHIPVSGDEDQLDAISKNYGAWINIHQGSEITFLKTRADTIPFFDESYASQIRADIKKGQQAKISQEPLEPVFSARLFLHIAQGFDMENWEINQDVALCKEMEQDLMSNLKGENRKIKEGGMGLSTLKPENSGDYMTSERCSAWSYLFLHDQMQTNQIQTDQKESELFVTHSRLAFETFIEKAPEAEEVLYFDAIPVRENRADDLEIWQDSLMKHLNILAQNKWPATKEGILNPPDNKGNDKKVSLTVFIVPGKSPQEFFARFVNNSQVQASKGKKDIKFNNTLIGLVEF